VEANPAKDKVVIYQVMTRLFGNKKTSNVKYGTKEENGVGKFNDFTEVALRQVKELGVTHVWYTGVIEHAVVADYSANGIKIDDVDVVKGRAGSPYAIKDYYDVNPDLADDIPNRLSEFGSLIDRTHQAGLKAIIDFVPNHVARKYISDAKPKGVDDFGVTDDTSKAFSPQNNFYYIPGEPFQVPEDYEPIPGFTFATKDQKFDEFPAKATGNDKFEPNPSQYDWFETVKLNYGVDYQNDRQKHFDPIPDTWHKMKDILAYWTGLGIDGFRCDMAEMVPVEFWGWVIPQIQLINPEIVFIAEIYNPNEYENYIWAGKFDYLYDKVELYDTLRHIIEGKGSTNHVSPIILDFEAKKIENHMLRFMENHDEQRLASRFFAGDPWLGWPALALSATVSNGPVMIYFGQEIGEPGLGAEGFQGDDGRTTIFDYWGVPEYQKWMNDGKFDGGKLSDNQKALRDRYSRLLNLCNSNPTLRRGKFIELHLLNSNSAKGYKNDKVYTFLKQNENEVILCAFNFSLEDQEIDVLLPEAFSDVDWNKNLELLTSEAFTFSKNKEDLLRLNLEKNQVLFVETNIQN
jgi:glycosidase